MARPRNFDAKDVLDKALWAFWRKGYEGCSFDILVTETGLSRQSLYNAFGDKDALFRAVIAHYTGLVESHLNPLKAPSAGLSAARDFMKESLKQQVRVGPGACFLVITAFADRAEEPAIRRAVSDGAEMVRVALAGALSNAVEAGDLPDGFDARAGSDVLYGAMNGMSALARTGAGDAQIEDVLEFTFGSLKAARSVPQ